MSDDNVTPIRAPVAAVPRPPRFPQSVREKIAVAKSILQAVTAADQSGNLEGENYDSFWPLRMATELLEQAAEQIDREKQEASHG